MAQADQVFGYADNSSAFANAPSLDAPVTSRFSLLQDPKIALGFCFLLVVVLGRVFSGGRKLPPGVKPLPRLPGTFAIAYDCVL